MSGTHLVTSCFWACIPWNNREAVKCGAAFSIWSCWCYLGTAWAEEKVRLPATSSERRPHSMQREKPKRNSSVEPFKYLSGCLNQKPKCPRRRENLCAQEKLCFQNMFQLFEVQVDFIGWTRCWLELAVTLFTCSVGSTNLTMPKKQNMKRVCHAKSSSSEYATLQTHSAQWEVFRYLPSRSLFMQILCVMDMIPLVLKSWMAAKSNCSWCFLYYWFWKGYIWFEPNLYLCLLQLCPTWHPIGLHV